MSAKPGWRKAVDGESIGQLSTVDHLVTAGKPHPFKYPIVDGKEVECKGATTFGVEGVDERTSGK